ncbi:MAG: flagellar basal body L-ring protein FlgH [candidate division KSB1 bacterium]|nr:flagellar basal body L-ring protein FlgH [candidate division KSB1 bacterium]
MRKLVLACVLGMGLALCQPPDGAGQVASAGSLYADHKAHRVGDIITVLVVEEAVASSKASTTTDRNTGAEIDVRGGMKERSFLPLAGFRGGAGTDFSGKGQTERQGVLKARISATVVAVRENGDLEIEGSREVIVNGERELTTIKGVVRPSDISAQNTVYSYNVAEAQIAYKGSGAVHSGQKPSFLARLLNWFL